MGAFEQITVNVPAEVAEAMRQSVKDGAYQSTDAIVDDALRDWIRLGESDGRDLEALREAVRRSDASGPGIPADQAFAYIRARIAERQANR